MLLGLLFFNPWFTFELYLYFEARLLKADLVYLCLTIADFWNACLIVLLSDKDIFAYNFITKENYKQTNTLSMDSN